MFTKTIFALTFLFATASGALAAPKHDVYDARGAYSDALHNDSCHSSHPVFACPGSAAGQ